MQSPMVCGHLRHLPLQKTAVIPSPSPSPLTALILFLFLSLIFLCIFSCNDYDNAPIASITHLTSLHHLAGINPLSSFFFCSSFFVFVFHTNYYSTAKTTMTCQLRLPPTSFSLHHFPLPKDFFFGPSFFNVSFFFIADLSFKSSATTTIAPRQLHLHHFLHHHHHSMLPQPWQPPFGKGGYFLVSMVPQEGVFQYVMSHLLFSHLFILFFFGAQWVHLKSAKCVLRLVILSWCRRGYCYIIVVCQMPSIPLAFTGKKEEVCLRRKI